MEELRPYRTVTEPVLHEWIEKKSRFICTLFPVDSEAAISVNISNIRKTYPDASHYCTAWRLSEGFERSNDDGEPSGTAGRPMLHVLKQHQLTQVLAIVTRYFGGTLLGAGGLVRAYTQSVAEAVQVAKVVEYKPHDVYQFRIPYTDFDKTDRMLRQFGYQVEATFTDQVEIVVYALQKDRFQIQSIISEITLGSEKGEPILKKLIPTPIY